MGTKNCIKFPCSYTSNGKIITITNCEKCSKSIKCDVYALILNECEDD